MGHHGECERERDRQNPYRRAGWECGDLTQWQSTAVWERGIQCGGEFGDFVQRRGAVDFDWGSDFPVYDDAEVISDK